MNTATGNAVTADSVAFGKIALRARFHYVHVSKLQ
jgi:hypothetical protein